MRKFISKILITVIAAGLLFALSACGTAPSKSELSSMVGEAILQDNASIYRYGECSGEGHKILGSRASGSKLKVYALTTYGSYGFQNDMFVKVSGSGVIPAVLTFEKNSGEYELIDIEYPGDGTEYAKSIKRMFPLQYRPAAFSSEQYYEKLASLERAYAAQYLESIGREAQIGEYSDLNTVLLTDLGVSVLVSNKVTCDKNLAEYPDWIGTVETIEDGIRYVRSMSYDEEARQIIYCTVEKDTGEVMECFVFDSDTGEALSAGEVISQLKPAELPEVTNFTESAK